MGKEIGGYFEFGDLVYKPFYESDCIKLNCARNCLLYLIQMKNITKIFFPKYICDSVYKQLMNSEIDLEFYDINDRFQPLFKDELSDNEYLYIVNYYGQLSLEDIRFYKQKFGNIILDNVQSFFQRPLHGVDTIYTCRKYFGVPDGAYLFTDINNCYFNLEFDITQNRVAHLLGRCEANASSYYSCFSENEEYFDFCNIKLMSKISNILMGAIDYKNVIKQRNENFMFLHDKLNYYNELSINYNEGAFAYPLKITNGEKIRNKLIENSIFVSVLWPNVLNDDKYKDFAENILPLPCDQRYNVEDMKRIVKIIKEEL